MPIALKFKHYPSMFDLNILRIKFKKNLKKSFSFKLIYQRCHQYIIPVVITFNINSIDFLFFVMMKHLTKLSCNISKKNNFIAF